MVDRIIERIQPYPNVLCLDISSFDSAQRGMLWDIEDCMFRMMVGPNLYRLHQACALDTNIIVQKQRNPDNGCKFKFAMMTTTTRNSGEMPTSATNTYLSSSMIRYALEKLNIQGTVLSEGDDSIVGYLGKNRDEEICDVISRIGFQTTVESSTSSLVGASFCKIVFTHQTHGTINPAKQYVGWRDPLLALAKFGWTRHVITKQYNRLHKALLQAKTCSLMATYPYS